MNTTDHDEHPTVDGIPERERAELKDCQIQTIKNICHSFRHDEGELINILHKTQESFGYLPPEIQECIARELRIPVAKVYGVVTFYTFFSMQPKGKYPISICLGTACYVRGSEKIVEALKNELGIDIGGITPDGKFSLDCLRCVGACGLAPVMLIGDRVHGRVDPLQIKDILTLYT
ncbi:MAG: NAD(P)H-dependent oxidoreductase subunit E [Prevotellaceae bacterium]|jgi:NADH-quinone oxidoreductase subunit E/NADP-reducing hydrogenase subunit HndA|nr:NAD(P)H-dependent oxidoreductase subunit E [Prevotellaceae bacterium]